ncbi:MAG: aspartate aminotransferase family protein [Gammaproteobacteria bacterium]|nr:aspartate aminotransferase family protein [Gammaproteobacteria bacterium]MDH5303699.1 aspartate aminotransferase family protein [Gammaproteobacteria bacterium]MDH5322668.1 aspartate aminotransferase family protein [Gammaproteobacteria bacterium]
MLNKARRSIAPTPLPKVSHGAGSYVFDSSGKRYIDGSGGPAVYCLGHAHAEVNEAIRQQLELIAHGYRYTFTSDPLIRLTELIQSQAGPGFEQILYVSSGSEAVESALKIALQFHWGKGDRKRTRFISRQRSYHGNTLGALAVSGFAQRRKQFEGSLFPCSFLSTANEYRPAIAGTAAQLTDYLAAELEQEILKVGAENVAAFIFEPVVGAAGGMLPAPAGYAAKMRAVCTRYGVLMIADEVMCGAGRCGSWRALAEEQVLPDIMTIAKGLGGGYVPLGAVAYSGRIAETIVAADGAVNTGHTFTGHTLACASAAAVQQIVVRDRLIERVRSESAALRQRLVASVGELPAVGDLRVRGFFAGVELVADRDSRHPFDPDLKLAEIVRARTLQEGLICYPVSGTIDGVNGDVVIISPPYNASDAELDEIADKLGRGLRLALADIGAA